MNEEIKYTAISTKRLMEMMEEFAQPLPIDFSVYKRPPGEKSKYEVKIREQEALAD